MSELKFPTETVELPSKGLLYPPENPLSSGKVQIKYMTSAEEDILTNSNYIKSGVVYDKLLEALIVDKINYDDLILGDKDALFIASRVLAYGKNYTFQALVGGEIQTITADLTTLKDKELSKEILDCKGVNSFNYTLPYTNTEITYKYLTRRDEREIEEELKGYEKLNKKSTPELSTRLSYIITSVGGNTSKERIREFAKNMLTMDSRPFRSHINKTTPGPDLTIQVTKDDYTEEGVYIPMGINFFWPDA